MQLPFETMTLNSAAASWWWYERMDEVRRLQGIMMDAAGFGPQETPSRDALRRPGFVQKAQISPGQIQSEDLLPKLSGHRRDISKRGFRWPRRVKNPVSDRILGRVPSTLVPVVDFANSIVLWRDPGIVVNPSSEP